MTYKKQVRVDNSRFFGKVAVLYGGVSSEREISLLSGTAVYNALQHNKIEAILIDTASDIVSQLFAYQPDRVWIALHGTDGEDGTVQGLLECMGIPYTGSGVMASALAMDKYRSKLLWQSVGLPTPDFILANEDSALSHCNSLLPAFVKPVMEGSSVGVTRVDRESELKEAWRIARGYNKNVLVEKMIAGPEYTVAILNGQPLPAIRIKSSSSFYDYQSKYLSDETEYLLPCGLTKNHEQEMQAIALTAFEILGCSGWGRVDFMQDEYGRFWLLEVNTIPGMTDHSLVPMAGKAASLSFGDLVVEILYSSVVRSMDEKVEVEACV
ncbi:D-alanine--D-alanine ligase B [invertebrate metagenome]|uniref:D-alanine--D-alanine ligase B n=1 Tax=invertebrate metagenome TaxID=1711999 RepID=A0A2H9TAY7_9ZZZZ